VGALRAPRPHLDAASPRRGADDPDALAATARELLDRADLLLLTGGVSMGERDFVPGVLRSLGARVLFHKVPQRPGKPILAARLPDGRTILALPGNPVSVLVTARRFAIPLLDRLAGRPHEQPPYVAIERPDDARLDLWWHRIARHRAPGVADLIPGKGSGDIVAAARADGFVEVPPHQGGPGPWPFYTWA
jgi:molybdopterin biosynthesis enzyme